MRQALFDGHDECSLCPRNCRAARAIGSLGYCGATADLKVARAALHHWEEPPISGNRGSGTVFFSHCSLRCVYCQNHDIASGTAGKIISARRLAEIFLEQQHRGAHNINLVTPTHYVPQIIEALDLAKDNGLSLPVVYNTSGYETAATIAALANHVDIYLTDFKYWDPDLARRYSNAPDYPDVARKALKAMHETCEPYMLDKNGILESGIIVRHLFLPGNMDDSKRIIRYLHLAYGNDICLSLMNQYTPLSHMGPCPELDRTVSDEEYDELIDLATSLGFDKSFIQEGGTSDASYIPSFDNEGV